MSYFNPLFRFTPKLLNNRVHRYVADHAWVMYPPLVLKKMLDQFLQKAKPVLVVDDWITADRPAKALELLIGDTILDIRHYYEPESINGWLDCSTTYITTQNNGVLSFPISGDDVFYNVEISPKAQAVSDMFRARVVGQRIRNIYYYYNEEGEPEEGHLSFLELENGYVIAENTGEPGHTGLANLFLYTHDEFLKIVKESPSDILPWNTPGF